MDKRQLGKSDLRVSPLCFGGNVFGWTVDERTSFALLAPDAPNVRTYTRDGKDIEVEQSLAIARL